MKEGSITINCDMSSWEQSLNEFSQKLETVLGNAKVAFEEDCLVQRSKLDGINEFWDGTDWTEDDFKARACNVFEAKGLIFGFGTNDETYQWVYSIIKKRDSE